MRLLIWSLTAIAVAAWSFVSWLAHLVVQAGGGLLANNADLVPPIRSSSSGCHGWRRSERGLAAG